MSTAAGYMTQKGGGEEGSYSLMVARIICLR